MFTKCSLCEKAAIWKIKTLSFSVEFLCDHHMDVLEESQVNPADVHVEVIQNNASAWTSSPTLT